ncbi:hypothetical protein CLAIMM_10290 isoform 3, partial [Cladophialophora immunda]
LGLPSLITSFPPGCFDAVGLLSFSHGLLDLYPCSPSIMSDGLHTSGPLQSRREGARIQRRLLDATSTLCNHASFLVRDHSGPRYAQSPWVFSAYGALSFPFIVLATTSATCAFVFLAAGWNLRMGF